MAGIIFIYTDGDRLITCPIDDDDSAMSKAQEVLRDKLGINKGLDQTDRFEYLGEMEHNDITFSIIQYKINKNQIANINKISRVKFDLTLKEFESDDPSFKVNDSFNLGIGLKLAS